MYVEELSYNIERFIWTTQLYSKQFTQFKHVIYQTFISLYYFLGQQWSDDNPVGKLADGHTDFEGNGVFSKLLLDVSLGCLN